MKEDFDRLNRQLQKRKEKEESAVKNVQDTIEERLYRINLLNKRNESALEKVQK